MATERNVVDFKIHNLTEEQFQELKAQGKIDPNAVYCTPDTTKERLDALETKTTSLEENKQDIATAVNYDNISNCITEIPQDIKLEINSENKLVVKAGTTYYVPNGVGVFEKRTVTTDLVWNYTGTASGQRVILINSNGTGVDCPSINNVFSGGTQPTQAGVYWYDTTNNVVNAVTSALIGGLSLTLGVITITNGVVTSIDQVFNGFGYIGGARFILPGVEGLAPDGFNADGTYKSVKWTTTSVLVRAIDTAGNYIDATSGTNIGMGQYIYDPATNYVYLSIISPAYRRTLTTYGHVTLNNGRVESYKTKTAFRAVDYNDFELLSETVETNNDNAVHKTDDETISGVKTFTSEVQVKGSQNAYRIVGPSYGSFWRQDNKHLYLMLTNAGDPTGTWNDFRPITVELETGTLVAPSPSASSNDRSVATTAWVKSALSGNNIGLAQFSKAQNGYYKFSNGLIIQWGRTGTEAAQTATNITFPTAFSTNNSFSLSAVSNMSGSAIGGYSVGVSNVTTTGFTYRGPNSQSSVDNNCFWIAIGY